MKSEDIHSRLKHVISSCSNVDVPFIKDNTDFFGDIGYDSLDMTDLIIQIEHEFDIIIKTSDMRNIETYQDAYDVVVKELKAKDVAIQ